MEPNSHENVATVTNITEIQDLVVVPIRPPLITDNSFDTLVPAFQKIKAEEGKSYKDSQLEESFEDERTINEFSTEVDESYDIKEEYPDGGLRANLVVFGSFLGLIANFGYSNSIGSIESEVSTTILKSVPSSTISWIFAVYMALMYAGNIFCGAFFDKYGARKPMILGTILLCGSITLTGQCTQVWQFALVFGIVGGIGSSLSMTPLISVISHWFLLNRATATGLATMGGSVGGIIFPMMLRALFPRVGFAWSMRILGFVCLTCLICSILLIKERFRAPSSDGTPFWKELIQLSALKDKRFLAVIMGLCFTELSLMATTTYISSYAIGQGYSSAQGALLITIFNGSGIPARWLSGFLADRWGNFNVITVTCFIVAILNIAMWYPFGADLKVLYAFTTCYGIFTSSILTLTPVCCGQICKVQEFGKRYSTMYFFVAFGNMFGIVICGTIIGSGLAINYDHLVLFISALSCAGASIWALARVLVGGWKFTKC